MLRLSNVIAVLQLSQHWTRFLPILLHLQPQAVLKDLYNAKNLKEGWELSQSFWKKLSEKNGQSLDRQQKWEQAPKDWTGKLSHKS